MTPYIHLSLEYVLKIHAKVLAQDGGADGIRSMELLESAISAPQASFGGELIIKNGLEIAASYLYYLCRNHPFVDGNKRVALTACLFFLKANKLCDFRTLDIDRWERLVLDVASSELDRAQTTARLAILMRDHEQ